MFGQRVSDAFWRILRKDLCPINWEVDKVELTIRYKSGMPIIRL